MSLLQMAGGVVAAGVVAAGATAVTGSGVVRSGTAADAFVGGTVTQLVTGASITAVTYGYADTGKTQTNSIAITVTNAGTRYITVTPGGTGFSVSPVADEWNCADGTTTVNAATPKILITGASDTITCQPANSGGGDAIQGYYSGLSSLQMAVTIS